MSSVVLSDLSFHWYGFFIGLGILASASASEWLARRKGFPRDTVWNGLWWVLVPAIVGARLYHVADLWQEVYSNDLTAVLRVWEGGLGIWGGIFGGMLGILGYWKIRLRTTNYELQTVLDIVFFGLPLGQAIGRIGNFLNQEVYGLPSSLPWAIRIDPAHRLPGFESFETFHPLFGYEMGLGFLGFLVMLGVEKNYTKLRKVTILSKVSHFVYKSFAGFYLVWYGTGRFFLEFLRPAAFIWTIGTSNVSHIASFVAIGLGLILSFTTRVRNTPSP